MKFLLMFLFLPMLVFAQTTDLPAGDFLTQVFDAVKAFGGLPWAGKIVLICGLVVASMKVSILRTLVWDKAGPLKVLVAPLLALIAGGLSLGTSATRAQLTAYFLAGAGAILLKNLLDAVKAVPMLGDKYIKMIDFIQGLMDKLGVGHNGADKAP